MTLIYTELQVWFKPNGEMPFLYGNHVLKAHLGRITEDTPEYQGVIVFSMSDVPLVSLDPLIPAPSLTPFRASVLLLAPRSIHENSTPLQSLYFIRRM